MSSYPYSIQAALPLAVNSQQLPNLAPMLEKITPAVVSISVSGTQVSKQHIPEQFRFFLGPDFPAEQVQERKPKSCIIVYKKEISLLVLTETA